MKNNRTQIVSLFTIFFLLVLSSCKTQEDIRREKTVENLNEQVAQTQKVTANSNTRFNSLEEEISKLTGKIEEITHNRQQEIKENGLRKQQLAQLEESNTKQNEFLKALNEKIQDQTKYIEQVVSSLNSINEQKELEKKKVLEEESDAKKENTLKVGVAKYKSHNYSEAKDIFKSLINNKKIKKKDKENSLYYLGMIEFKDKNYEESKVYFSKFFSNNPDSTFGASALIHLAKAFLELKSGEEALQSIDELIARYPKSKEAQDGIKLKAKIK